MVKFIPQHQWWLHSLLYLLLPPSCFGRQPNSESIRQKSLSWYVRDIDRIFYSQTIVVRNSQQSVVYMFVLSLCGFSVYDRKFPLREGGGGLGQRCYACGFLVDFASEEASWFAFVLTLTIPAPPCPPTLLSFLPSCFICLLWRLIPWTV